MGGGSDATPHGARDLVLALVLLVALGAIALVRDAPPEASGADASDAEFSSVRALATLGRVFGDGAPHPVGSVAHERVRERIVAELERLGCAPTVQTTIGASPGGAVGRVENVVARIAGSSGGKAVLVCAHYDSVAAGPGAGDDGAGVACVLEIARALRSGPPPNSPARDVILLLDDGEEAGLLGAEAFVAEHPFAKDVGVVVNLEARGTSGPSQMFETSRGNRDLVAAFARATGSLSPAATSAAQEVYSRMPNDTDLTVFKRHGFAGLNFAFIGGLRHYHTPLDDLAHLSPASVQHQGENALAVVRELAASEDLAKARETGDTAYFDVLHLVLVRWPLRLAVPLAAVALLALLGVAFRALRRRECAAAGIVWGLGGALATLVAAAGVGFGAAQGVALLRATADAWPANPVLTVIALVAGTLGIVALLPFPARAGPAGACLGAWILLSVLALVAAIVAPGASHLHIVPALVAAVALLVHGPRARASTIAPLLAAALMWFPLAIALLLAFETRFPPGITMPFGVVALGLQPLLASCPARSRRILAVLALLASAGAFVASLAQPTRTAEQPWPLNVAHVLDADRGAARFVAVSPGLELPPEMRAAARFSAQVETSIDGWPSLPRGFTAEAPSWPAPAPTLEVVGETERDGQRIVRTRVASGRGARWIMVQAPAGGACLSVTWHGKTVLPWLDGRRTIRIVGFGADEVEVALRLPSKDAAEVRVLDADSTPTPALRELARLRPRDRVPIGEGDCSIVHRRVRV